MTFTNGSTVSDIALSNPGARNILEDAGIDYCCGGGISLQEACLRANVSAVEILQKLQLKSEALSSDEARWTSAPLTDLTRHIRTRHHAYVRDAIPRLRAMLAKIREKHAGNHPEVGEIDKFFAKVSRDLLMHMQKEEQILFPFIDSLERASLADGQIEPPFFQTVRNPVYSMMKEHDSAGKLMRRIHEASNGYQPPSSACTTFRAAYQALDEFEKDLHLHVHLENNVLFSRAVALEPCVFCQARS